MKSETSHLYIVTFLMIILIAINLSTKKELKRSYEKGYNYRQAEIMQTLAEAENQCNSTHSGERSTGGVMLDVDIRLLPEVDDYIKHYDQNIIYDCRTERGSSVGSIWIGSSLCDCIDFDLKQ